MKAVMPMILCCLLTCCASNNEPDWKEIPRTDGSVLKYDKSSLRKTEDIAIINVEMTIGLSALKGSPALIKSTYLAQFDCRKRTIANSNISMTYDDGTTKHEQFWPAEIIPPNTPMEKVFDYACS